MTGLTYFEHEPLDLERPAFRLLQLLRGDGPTIECMLYQAYLDGTDTIPYDALSYTWGSKEDMTIVIVNGKPLRVTSNLHSALRHLRLPNTDRVLWVDAICIDQQNDMERGHQVQQMCKIYSQAEEVAVWLGQATQETEVFMDCLRRLEQYTSMHEYRTWYLNQWKIPWALITRPAKSELRRGLNTLLLHPWFKRVWILQEIARSKKARIWCGTKFVRAYTFAIAPSLINFRPKRHCQVVLDIIPGHFRQKSWWSESRDLYSLLLKLGESEATDPRDKVYALLGISSDAHNCEGLRPDYTKSVQDVINDTSSFLFGHSEVVCETMSKFITDLSFKNSLHCLNLVRYSNGTGVEQLVKRQGLDKSLLADTFLARTENRFNESDIAMLMFRELNVIGTKSLIRIVVEENVTSSPHLVSILFPRCKTSFEYEEVLKILQAASAEGDDFTVKLLVENSAVVDSLGFDGNAQDRFYKYALYAASVNGQNSIVQLLFEWSTKVAAVKSLPWNSRRDGIHVSARHNLALALASAYGRVNVVQSLIERGVDASMAFLYSGHVPHDCGNIRHEAVMTLAENDPRLNVNGMIYVNPLYLASKNGHREVEKHLLYVGAKSNMHQSGDTEGLQTLDYRLL